MSRSMQGSGEAGRFGRGARSFWQGLVDRTADILPGVSKRKRSESGREDDGLPDPIILALSGPDPGEDRVRRYLQTHSRPVSPVVKCHALNGFEGLPDGMEPGWVQWPETRGRFFSLGFFTGHRRFTQVALADDRGRVFPGSRQDMDVQGVEAAFLLGKEQDVDLPYGRRFGRRTPDPQAPVVRALQGDIAGRDSGGHLCWLASWLKYDNRYTLEQMRPDLPAGLRFDLEFRDAVAVSFFATYFLPRLHGGFTGFGAGNIFRRLNRQAPLRAIRGSVQDAAAARSSGQRVSGLEDLFTDLMKEAGALDPAPGLEAVHGSEPLHLYASSYSGGYFLTWSTGLEFQAALRALKIEGNLNRFALVSSWLERNSRLGVYPTEDSVTRVQAAQIDQALMADPAVAALLREGDYDAGFDLLRDDGRLALNKLVDKAAATAAQVRRDAPPALPVEKGDQDRQVSRSEWVYRQTLAGLTRSLRLPFRYDLEFRSNLEEGRVAMVFTSAGRTMMPSDRYDGGRRAWVALDADHRAAMSADYNLKVGLILAALAFGTDPSIAQVSLLMESVGLEEAVDEQNSAIRQMMGQALEAFERMRSGEMGSTGSKADPKDGDVHGDPTHPIANESMSRSDEAPAGGSAPVAGADEPGASSSDEASSDPGSAQGQVRGPEDGGPSGAQADGGGEEPADRADSSDINREFTDLMKGVDLDDMSFAAPALPGQDQAGQGTPVQGDGTDRPADGGGEEDPMQSLRRNPSVRNLVSVTFTRELFLSKIRQEGLNEPKGIYRFFDAAMKVGADGGLEPVDTDLVDIQDARYAPEHAQEEPEFCDEVFTPQAAAALGADRAVGLSIQRADLLQRAMSEFRRLAADQELSAAAKAQGATEVIRSIGDPELDQLSSQVASAMIDETEVPDFDFVLSSRLDAERVKARDLLFSGSTDQALQTEGDAIDRLDALFASGDRVPRYFNSYAERVVYNRLFATPGEHTLLIPDNLFYAHLEIADILTQMKETDKALKHLNAMVSYAPAYPLSHLKLAVQLAMDEDWDSARAATLNALRVALDRDDASFAYYRLAYASWMRDEFDVAAAAYIMSEHISPGRLSTLKEELAELNGRAEAQCIPVPKDYDEARLVLHEHGLPVWPHTEVASIVREAARVCVDGGLFVPARTLSMAAARMNDDDNEGVDVVQAQFMRSLNA